MFNITGGPLSYTYKIIDIKFHYGIKGYAGSEHKIGNKSFPAEVHNKSPINFLPYHLHVKVIFSAI